jgi:hypothetical protein
MDENPLNRINEKTAGEQAAFRAGPPAARRGRLKPLARCLPPGRHAETFQSGFKLRWKMKMCPEM